MPKNSPKNPKHVVFELVDEHKGPAPITEGAVGSIHPSGKSILVNLYYEHRTLPSSHKYPVDEAGVVHMDQGEEEVKTFMTRVIHSQTIMTPEVALIIAEWLTDNAHQARRIAKKQDESSAENESPDIA